MAKRGTKGSDKAGGPLPPTDHNENDDVKAMTFFGYAKRWQSAKDALAIIEEEAKAKLGKHAIRDIRTWASLKDEKGEEKLKEKIEAQRKLVIAMASFNFERAWADAGKASFEERCSMESKLIEMIADHLDRKLGAAAA